MSEEINNGNLAVYPSQDPLYAYGLTKRELFAALAMQGLIICPGISSEAIARTSVREADLLLKELAK
jgi:Co/Zn/Cd efflux system component